MEGVGLTFIAQEVLFRHQRAFRTARSNWHVLEVGGQSNWRDGGE